MRIACFYLIVLSLCSANAYCATDTYVGSRFQDVWKQVTSDPYAVLPHQKVKLTSLFTFFHNYLLDAASRTLDDKSDLLPPFQKLVHFNGVCFAGTWNITEENPYTGYFEKGKIGQIIVRASVANSPTERGSLRAFGLAGKLYPTNDPNDPRVLKTANFFTIEDLGGTLTPQFLDATLTNEPLFTKRFPGLLIGTAIGITFGRADSHPNLRQVYPIAELGMKNISKAKVPGWIMLKAAPGQRRVEFPDFRDELRLQNHDGKLVFNISVSSNREQGWQQIGFINLTQDVASYSCDHRLHFTHDKFLEDK